MRLLNNKYTNRKYSLKASLSSSILEQREVKETDYGGVFWLTESLINIQKWPSFPGVLRLSIYLLIYISPMTKSHSKWPTVRPAGQKETGDFKVQGSPIQHLH